MHTSKHTIAPLRRTALPVMAVVMTLCAATATATADSTRPATQIATPQRTAPQRSDTVRRPATPIEVHDMRSRMMTSPQPVSIRQQGRLLCVESQVPQMLPVYTQSGTFYTAFRLTKGTNWLSGLPRGRYIINNRHFAIN